jgi:hypothetical protein
MLLKLCALLMISCGENANVHKVLVGKPKEGDHLEVLHVDGMIY